MSDVFSDREKGFERKYQLDQDQQFRAGARRDKLFGLWAAQQMGIVGADADTYAKEVVASNFEKPGDDDMIGKVLKDLSAKKVALDERALKKKLTELQAEAARQIVEEKK